MIVYRISKTIYAHSLNAPGIYGRWNSDGKKVIYTGGSMALSCLEVAVHRSGASLSSGNFSITSIQLPDVLAIEEILIDELIGVNSEWYKPQNSLMTQHIGDDWLDSFRSIILKVPSAIISGEFNYLLNVDHPEFHKISIGKVEPFVFDPRLKMDP